MDHQGPDPSHGEAEVLAVPRQVLQQASRDQRLPDPYPSGGQPLALVREVPEEESTPCIRGHAGIRAILVNW